MMIVEQKTGNLDWEHMTPGIKCPLNKFKSYVVGNAEMNSCRVSHPFWYRSYPVALIDISLRVMILSIFFCAYLAICTSSWRKVYSDPLANSNGVIFLLLSFKSSLYSLDSSPFSGILLRNGAAS